MAYATVQDMIERWGEQEMIRLSTPDGQDMESIHPDRIERALSDASDTVDTYLRKRYRVPMDLPPAVCVRAVCVLARCDLQTGEQMAMSEDARNERKDVITWLRDIAEGRVLLDLEEVKAGDNSYAQMSERSHVVFQPGPTTSVGGFDL